MRWFVKFVWCMCVWEKGDVWGGGSAGWRTHVQTDSVMDGQAKPIDRAQERNWRRERLGRDLTRLRPAFALPFVMGSWAVSGLDGHFIKLRFKKFIKSRSSLLFRSWIYWWFIKKINIQQFTMCVPVNHISFLTCLLFYITNTKDFPNALTLGWY